MATSAEGASGHESQRQEARRTQRPGETFFGALNRVRRERAEALGYSGAAGVGHGGGLRSQVSLGGVVIDRHGSLVEVNARGPAEVSRFGSYLHDRRAYLRGELPGAAFDRTWAGRSLLGVRLGGADQILAAAHSDDEGLAREVRYERRGR